MLNQNMQPLPHYFASLEAFETQLEQVAGIKEMMEPLQPFLLNYGELEKAKSKHALLRYVDFIAVSLEHQSRAELLELSRGLFALLNFYVSCIYGGAKNSPVLTSVEKYIFATFGTICHNIAQNISMDAHQVCDARSFDTYIDFRFEYEDQTGAASTAIISSAFDPLFKILGLLKYIQSKNILDLALVDEDLLPEGKYKYSSYLIQFLTALPSCDQFQIWLNLHGSSAQASGISNDELMESYTLSLFPSDLDNNSRQFVFKDLGQGYLDLTLHAQHPSSSENFFLKMDNDEEQLCSPLDQ